MTEDTSTGMRVVDVVIRGNTYRVACSAGEEQRLGELASRLSKLVEAVSSGGKSGSKTSDTLLLLLAGLKLEDKVGELSQELDRVTKELSEYKEIHGKEARLRGLLEELLCYSLSRTKRLLAYVNGEHMKNAQDTESEVAE
ncbi:cell division protein ZapA [Anaplasma capra]|uniref:cell division protein ZapA n=1 Tax=Anaplasma capra TaxID=1562740 RepID=UPI0021D57C59|nr:cell division protein ZapA [Anaplasma capra]MCU7611897.1 cell division protein ZapA [Anaplasma capra]MCU7612756.1 cell division protein ZapA [Anaplasma capra]